MAAKKKTVKKTKPKPKPLAPLAQRVGSDPALLAKALANPGLRSKLPDKYLSATQKAQRQGNLPVVPGSSLTNRAAQSQAQTNTDLYFGPNAQAKQEQQNRDVLGWYDQYKADLANHAKNIGDINSQANTAIGGLSSGIRPLADQALAEQKAREGAQAGVTGSTPQDQTKTASDASAVRQAMIAALGSAEAGRGSARASQADTLANVVAPGYRVQAGVQGQQALRDLVDKMSAYKSKQLGDITNAESQSQAEIAKQNLALAIATGHDTTDLAQSKITASSSKAQRASAAANARAGRAVTKRGQTLSHEDRVAARKAADARAAAKKKAGKSPWVNPGAQGKVADSIGQALHYAKQAKNQKLNRHDAAGLLVEGQKADAKTGAQSVPSIDQLYASVALDIAYDGHISQANIKRLHARGIKVNSLGYPTKPGKVKARPGGFGGTALQNVINATAGALK